MTRPLFITGTGTGVGKTVLTSLLVRSLRARAINAAALKPVCSGGRSDARRIAAAMGGVLALDEINPWHFRAPIAPLLAARREKKKLTLPPVIRHVRRLHQQFDQLIIEGAGGLLSPLGEHFDSRDVIRKLGAVPVIVAPNTLGVINQVRLTLEALPARARAQAKVVLMTPQKSDAASGTNLKLLEEFFDRRRLFSLPWLGRTVDVDGALRIVTVQKTLRGIADH